MLSAQRNKNNNTLTSQRWITRKMPTYVPMRNLQWKTV